LLPDVNVYGINTANIAPCQHISYYIEHYTRVVRPWPWPRGQIFWPWPWGFWPCVSSLGLVQSKVKVTNILPNTVYLGIITLTVHWYTSVIGTAIVRRQDCLLICCGLLNFAPDCNYRP